MNNFTAQAPELTYPDSSTLRVFLSPSMECSSTEGITALKPIRVKLSSTEL